MEGRTHARRRSALFTAALGIIAALVAAAPPATADIGNAVAPAPRAASSLSLGAAVSCALRDSGEVVCWGSGSEGMTSAGLTGNIGDDSGEMGEDLVPVDLGTGVRAVQIAVGSFHACAILEDGSVKCWGMNHQGQIGIGRAGQEFPTIGQPPVADQYIGDDPAEMGDALPAVQLGAGRTAVALAVGYAHSCALLDNGDVKCWGDGSRGQTGRDSQADIGDGPNEMGDDLSPIALGSDAVAISASGNHTCAVLLGGDVKCWGYAANGRVGDGDGSEHSVGDSSGEMGNLQPLALPSAAVAIASGTFHNCVILDDGTVRCFGGGFAGQLGYGNGATLGDAAGEIALLGAVSLGSGRTATAITAGDQHTCALLDDGSVKCWGRGDEGQIGNGGVTAYPGLYLNTMGDSLAPVALGSGRTARAVEAGDFHTCAVLDDGSVKCWGDGGNGRLGLGDTTTRGTSTGTMGDALPPVDVGDTVDGYAMNVVLDSMQTDVVAGSAFLLLLEITNPGRRNVADLVVSVPGTVGCSGPVGDLEPGDTLLRTCKRDTTLADVGTVQTTATVTTGVTSLGQPFSKQSGPVGVRVAAPVYKPDLAVRAGSAAFVGGNVYSTRPARQTVSTSVRRGRSVRLTVRLENDGTAADRIRVTGSRPNADFAVAYFRGSTNITRYVLAGTYRTGSLAAAGVDPAGKLDITVVVTPKRAAVSGDTIRVVVTGTSVNGPTKSDAVSAVVRRR